MWKGKVRAEVGGDKCRKDCWQEGEGTTEYRGLFRWKKGEAREGWRSDA